MSKFVRFTKNFDHWPNASILTPFKKGEERRITEAQYEAANAAGAVELINGESAEQGTASAEAGSPAPKGKGRNSARG
jgi:hypothetical protein